MDFYHQPDYYRFSRDSIQLADRVVGSLMSRALSPLRSPLRGLDLCCGSGVIGIEIMVKSRPWGRKLLFDFWELQEDFRPFLLKNLQAAGLMENRPLLHFASFEHHRDYPFLKESYDLVVANPPYYDPHSHRLSPVNPKGNICRFFLQGGRVDFLHTLLYVLRPGGEAFFLGSSDEAGQAAWEKAFFLIRGSSAQGHPPFLEFTQVQDGLSLYYFRSPAQKKLLTPAT